MSQTTTPTLSQYYLLREFHCNWALRVAKVFIKDDELVKGLLITSEPYRYCLIESYKYFIYNKELKSIENLIHADKMTIYREAIDWCGPGAENGLLKEISKCIHVLTYVLENKSYDLSSFKHQC